MRYDEISARVKPMLPGFHEAEREEAAVKLALYYGDSPERLAMVLDKLEGIYAAAHA